MVFFFQTRSVLKILVHMCISYVGSDVSAQKFRGLSPSLSYYMDEKEEKKGVRGFIKPPDPLLLLIFCLYLKFLKGSFFIRGLIILSSEPKHR